MKLKSHINNVLKDAFIKAGIDHEPMSVSEATKPEFGDYQFNGAMALSKKLGKNPREIANDILSNLDLTGVLSRAEIAGPGFINLWLNPLWIAAQCQTAREDERLGVEVRKHPIKVVVDYRSKHGEADACRAFTFDYYWRYTSQSTYVFR